MNLLDEVRSLFRPALVALSVDPAKIDEFVAMVKPAANPENGDYQANMAMAASGNIGM